MNRVSRLLLIVGLLTCLVGCDQTTKSIASNRLAGSPPISLAGGVVRLDYAMNPGGFLSIGGRLSSRVRTWLFIGFNVSVLSLIALGLVIKRRIGVLALISTTLLLAGGIGNLIDRLLWDGHVIDFMVVQIGPLQTGVFNVADIAIMSGAFSLVILIWRR